MQSKASRLHRGSPGKRPRAGASGFFEQIKTNDPLIIKVSAYLYLDTSNFHIISIRSGDTVYLDEETGLSNVIHMMKSD